MNEKREKIEGEMKRASVNSVQKVQINQDVCTQWVKGVEMEVGRKRNNGLFACCQIQDSFPPNKIHIL